MDNPKDYHAMPQNAGLPTIGEMTQGQWDGTEELVTTTSTVEPRVANRPKQELGIDLGWIDSEEFANRVYEHKWLVDFLLKDGQPCIMAGPSKTLKTTIGIDLCISLASGTKFMDTRDCEKCNVAIVSAESGEETLQETAFRICKSKGLDFGKLGKSLFWAFRPPNISRADHIVSLADFITANEIQVLMIDPAYLTLGIGDEAKNQFQVGAVLSNLNILNHETGVTPILSAHTNKNIPVGIELDLNHIAYSGFGQWARQWMLLNRRRPYDATAEGEHDIWFNFGGSSGHTGAWGIDVREGSILTGRNWEFIVANAADVREREASLANVDKAQKAEVRRNRTNESRRVKILAAARGLHPEFESMTKIKGEAAMNSSVFKDVFQELVDEDYFATKVVGKLTKYLIQRDSTGNVIPP